MVNGEVFEVRGRDVEQEIPGEFLDVAKEKYMSLPGGKKFEKKDEDMRRLTQIYKRFVKDEDKNILNGEEVELTKEELRFLYEVDDKIEGFGYGRDKRIKKILDSRSERKREDIAKIFDFDIDEIALSKDEITEKTKVYYGDFNKTSDLEFLKTGKYNLEVVFGNIDFGRLEKTEDLIFPEKINYDIDLRGLRSIDGLNLSGVDIKYKIIFEKISIDELEKLAELYPYLKNQILTDWNMGYHKEY